MLHSLSLLADHVATQPPRTKGTGGIGTDDQLCGALTRCVAADGPRCCGWVLAHRSIRASPIAAMRDLAAYLRSLPAQ